MLQRVLERKVDVGPVALQCLFHLSTLGADAHRKAVYTIIERGGGPDTDHIYGGAVASMLKLSELTAADAQVIARALFGPSQEVRHVSGGALRSLEPHQLRRLIEINGRNVESCAPFAQAFADLANSTIAEVEVFQATVLPGLSGFNAKGN